MTTRDDISMTERAKSNRASVQITVNALVANSVIIAPGTLEAPTARPLGGWLSDEADKVQSTKEDLINTAVAIVGNTIQDVKDTLRNIADCTSGCLASVETIRTRVFNRFMEYTCDGMRFVIKSLTDVILGAQGQLGDSLQRPPNLQVVTLINPNQSVWLTDDNGQPIQPNFGLIDIDVLRETQQRKLIFVHGAGYDGSMENAFEYFRAFELAAGIFRDGPHEFEYVVVLVAWDSVMNGEDLQSIADALGVVLSGTVPPEIIWGLYATYWAELERRARVAAQQLVPWLQAAFSGPATAQTFAFSHSLGCYLWAEAISNMTVTFPNAGRWWCMEAAIPFGAFNREGPYTSVGAAYAQGDQSGLRVWYSNKDAVLSTLYVFATGTEAVGRWGVYGTGYATNTEDVTAEAGIDHDDGRILRHQENYWGDVGVRMRKALQSDINPIAVPTARD
jgi:hypothetical protein